LLEVEDLWFAYGNSAHRKYVLKGVSLRVDCCVACLLGPNGAGKTTLMKCIAGILKPERGRVMLEGLNITNMGCRSRARLVSYVPQEFTVKFPYTAFEVVLMGRNPYVNILQGPRAEDEVKAREALEALGVAHLAGKPFTSLSGGEKRLVLIARALAQDSKLLVLDEPTSFLDYKNKVMVLETLRKVSKHLGKPVLISLHDPNLALLFCDKVFLMREGNIIAKGRPDEVVTRDNIRRVYGINVRELRVNGYKLIAPENILQGTA